MDGLKLLVSDSKFWFALYALTHGLVVQFVPTFPKDMWIYLDGFVATVVGILCVKSAVKAFRILKVKLASKRLDNSTKG